MTTTNRKTVSLVLGSGGARGLAHIGVIHWLEENDFKIKSIVGCSIGAVIGGIYAAGKLDVYEQWVRCLTKVDIVTLLDLSGYLNLTKNLRASAGVYNLTDRQYWFWQDVRELDRGRADLQRFAQPGLNTRVTLTASF